MRLLVTGGSGFIGSHFIRYALRAGPTQVLNLDKLTYAGNPANLADVADDARYVFCHGDITDAPLVNAVVRDFKPDAIVHLAAESHVDRAILEPAPFLRTNVEGTQVLLEAALLHRVPRFLHVSTDEVYGTLGPHEAPWAEEARLLPNNLYAASKAGADLLARAAHRTHGLPVVITRCCNNYGPRQFPEKLIPLTILNATRDETIPMYGDGAQVRDWIHVLDHCRGLWRALEAGQAGEIYNLSGEQCTTNLAIVTQILAILDKPLTLIRFVPDRPGHDRRYAMDGNKASWALKFRPTISLETGLHQTVAWYQDNESWWRPILTGTIGTYYRTQYGSNFSAR